MGKYDPLRDYLERMSKIEWRAGFADVEKILGFRLPVSARKYPAWWANEESQKSVHSHSRSWVDAGWQTAELNLGNEQVIFRRIKKTR